MRKWGIVMIILVILAVIGCTVSNMEMPDNTDPWSKYEGIERYQEYMGQLLPFTRTINDEFRQLINPDTLPHAVKTWKKECELMKSMENIEIRAINAVVENRIDTTGTVSLDTFGLHYGVAVGRDTSFGALVFTAGRDIISFIFCKVYKDSLDRTTEEAVLTKEGSGEIINAKVTALNDSLIHGVWLLRDTTTNLRQIFEGDINTLSKEVPGVYEEIANFVVENNFFYIDSSKAPPLELLDEFCKEVLEGGETEKATNTNYGYVLLSGSIFYWLSQLTRIGGGWVGWIYSAGTGLLNAFIGDMLNYQYGGNSDNLSNIDWNQFYNDFYSYLLDLGYNPPPDALYVWSPGD